MKRAGENLDLVVGTGKGIGVFDRTVGEIENVAKTLDLPVGHSGKGCVTTGSARGRRVHDVAGEQEALFEDILAVTLVNTDEDFTSDDNTFLDMTCPIGPQNKFLLSSHIGLDFVRKTLGIVEDLTTHEFIVPFYLSNIPCGGIEGTLCGAF